MYDSAGAPACQPLVPTPDPGATPTTSPFTRSLMRRSKPSSSPAHCRRGISFPPSASGQGSADQRHHHEARLRRMGEGRLSLLGSWQGLLRSGAEHGADPGDPSKEDRSTHQGHLSAGIGRPPQHPGRGALPPGVLPPPQAAAPTGLPVWIIGLATSDFQEGAQLPFMFLSLASEKKKSAAVRHVPFLYPVSSDKSPVCPLYPGSS